LACFQGQRDPATLKVDVDDLDEDLVVDLDDLLRDLHVALGQLGDVHQTSMPRHAENAPNGTSFVTFPGIEGLVHISELAERHVEIPEQVVQVNDEIFVKVIDIDL